ncbi:hypothetical protein DFA_00802 [Cavenderia fasciculata]|uniref:Transmembrane protein n=1 Tax=Cavenderia fasciculata TaxID=261658 RepID=F4PTV5_CACFS|nr:uncharacterized protein DFA_00802 [Cavenderia fasciculata]EGG20934.1 hypothetical protein DFA_00802 [Cavenderia fasciculata]|eukprot:XP_004358784.1 hypothetical protein DFA_00802 [Cavenderia fasciculata]
MQQIQPLNSKRERIINIVEIMKKDKEYDLLPKEEEEKEEQVKMKPGEYQRFLKYQQKKSSKQVGMFKIIMWCVVGANVFILLCLAMVCFNVSAQGYIVEKFKVSQNLYHRVCEGTFLEYQKTCVHHVNNFKSHCLGIDANLNVFPKITNNDTASIKRLYPDGKYKDEDITHYFLGMPQLLGASKQCVYQSSLSVLYLSNYTPTNGFTMDQAARSYKQDQKDLLFLSE